MKYNKYKLYIIVPVLLALAGGGVAYSYLGNHKSLPVKAASVDDKQFSRQDFKEEKDKVIKTINPRLDNVEVSFLGKVISNKIVNIYPRRSGIVKDVFVDIGDKVKKGQVIAELLPVGVVGESSSLIYQQQVSVGSAKNNLEIYQDVADSEIKKSQQFVETAQEDLSATKKDSTAKIKALVSKLDKTEQDIESSKKVLLSIEDAYQAQIDQVSIDIESAEDSVLVDIQNALRQIQLVFFQGSTSTNSLSLSDITNGRFGYSFADKQISLLVESFNSVQQKIKNISVFVAGDKQNIILSEMLPSSYTALTMSRQIISNMPDGVMNITEVNGYLKGIDSAKAMLINSSGKFKNLNSRVKTLQASLLKEKSVVQRNINVGYAELERLKADISALEASTDKQIILAQERIKTFLVQKENVEKIQESKIINARNNLDVAKSRLRVVAVAKGNNSIISPFSGIVSQRIMQVGESVMPKMSVLRLDNVNTYLARKNPYEIDFGLPEQYKDLIKIDTPVVYWLLDNESKKYNSKIIRLGSDIDLKTRNIPVRAGVPAGMDLPNGAGVRLSIYLSKGYILPSSALRKDDTGDYVWGIEKNIDSDIESLETKVTDAGKLVLKKIYMDLMFKEGEFVYIKNELSLKLKVVLNPSVGWKEGMLIDKIKVK